jgi:hypothetical protein
MRTDFLTNDTQVSRIAVRKNLLLQTFTIPV